MGANNAQASRDRAFASGKKSPDQQRFGVFPNGLGEQRREFYNQRQQLGRQYWHMEDLILAESSSEAYAASRCFFKDQNWIKSSLTP
jgi:hypothetical protein